jgi:hypothetical protein
MSRITLIHWNALEAQLRDTRIEWNRGRRERRRDDRVRLGQARRGRGVLEYGQRVEGRHIEEACHVRH